MILYIAEKPSLGRAIANGLSTKKTKGEGFISLPNGDVVSWCIGHLLEQAVPESYDERYKKWDLNDLPINPNQWQLTPKSNTKKQLFVLKKLIKQAQSLVNAGDPDREGQLLVDEVIHYCGVKGAKLASVKRLLISDLNISAVKRSLSALKDNNDFMPLSASALARSRADWLYGMNMTRAYTLLGKSAGYNGVLSVGRVQTPLLGLVVARDHDIEHFMSKPFFEVEALLTTKNDEDFTAKWIPSDACEKYQDEERRVIYRKLAETVVNKTKNQSAVVTGIKKTDKKLNQPLPYNLSSLQIDAAKRFNIPAKQVLDCCQSLYEKHQAITYPRSDNRYIPLDHFKEASGILSTIVNNDASLKKAVEDSDCKIKSKAWNNNKVEAHHAIIPTTKKLTANALSANEQKIYQLIARQYIAQFYPVHSFSEQIVNIDIAGGDFQAKAKVILVMGWKELFNQPTTKASEDKTLPLLANNESLFCKDSIVIDKNTQPPKPFNDATLLSAMTGISRFVKDPAVRKVLKETDGLGTEATRANIIELLFKRQFLKRDNKNIYATTNGKALIQALPDIATTPDMTALWEAKLDDIAHKKSNYNGFMLPLIDNIYGLMNQARETPMSAFSSLQNTSKTPSYKKSYKKRRKYSAKRQSS